MANFTPSNRFLHELHVGGVDLSLDDLFVALMDSGFIFDRDAHSIWSDVSGSELPAGNGYSTGGQALSAPALGDIEDDANDWSQITWDHIVWVAAGGEIGPSPGAIVYDATHADDIILGYFDFGGDQTASSAGVFTLTNPLSRVQGG